MNNIRNYQQFKAWAATPDGKEKLQKGKLLLRNGVIFTVALLLIIGGACLLHAYLPHFTTLIQPKDMLENWNDGTVILNYATTTALQKDLCILMVASAAIGLGGYGLVKAARNAIDYAITPKVEKPLPGINGLTSNDTLPRAEEMSCADKLRMSKGFSSFFYYSISIAALGSAVIMIGFSLHYFLSLHLQDYTPMIGRWVTYHVLAVSKTDFIFKGVFALGGSGLLAFCGAPVMEAIYSGMGSMRKATKFIKSTSILQPTSVRSEEL